MTYRDDLRDSMREWVINLGYNPLRQPGDDLLPDQVEGNGAGTITVPAPEPEWPADLPPRVRALAKTMEGRA